MVCFCACACLDCALFALGRGERRSRVCGRERCASGELASRLERWNRWIESCSRRDTVSLTVRGGGKGPCCLSVTDGKHRDAGLWPLVSFRKEERPLYALMETDDSTRCSQLVCLHLSPHSQLGVLYRGWILSQFCQYTLSLDEMEWLLVNVMRMKSCVVSHISLLHLFSSCKPNSCNLSPAASFGH